MGQVEFKTTDIYRKQIQNIQQKVFGSLLCLWQRVVRVRICREWLTGREFHTIKGLLNPDYG